MIEENLLLHVSNDRLDVSSESMGKMAESAEWWDSSESLQRVSTLVANVINFFGFTLSLTTTYIVTYGQRHREPALLLMAERS